LRRFYLRSQTRYFPQIRSGHCRDKIFLDRFFILGVVLKLAFRAGPRAKDFMMKQQMSKINRRRRNQSLAPRVVKTGARSLPAIFAADFMKT
jgi:hypothetical protein